MKKELLTLTIKKGSSRIAFNTEGVCNEISHVMCGGGTLKLCVLWIRRTDRYY